MSFHNGVGLMVQGGMVIGSWDVIVQGVVARLAVVVKGWHSKKARRAKHKRDQGVSKMRVSGGAHGLANGPHLAMKKTDISLIHRFRRRQYVAPAQGGDTRT